MIKGDRIVGPLEKLFHHFGPHLTMGGGQTTMLRRQGVGVKTSLINPCIACFSKKLALSTVKCLFFAAKVTVYVFIGESKNIRRIFYLQRL